MGLPFFYRMAHLVHVRVALIDGDEFVRPEHVRELAVPVLAHRLALDPQAKFAGGTAQAVVEHILQTLPVPA